MRRFAAILLLCLFSTAAGAAQNADLALLFDRDRNTSYRINPLGDQVIYIRQEAKKAQDSTYYEQTIVLRDLSSGLERTLFNTSQLKDNKSSILNVRWIGGRQVYTEINERSEGVAQLNDTRNQNLKLVISTTLPSAPIQFIQTDGALVSALPNEEQVMLFGVSGSTSYVYRIDTKRLNKWGEPLGKTSRVDGGAFSRSQRVSEIDGYAFQWLSTADGVVKAVMHWQPEEGLKLSTRSTSSAEWVEQKHWRKPTKRGKERSRQKQLIADLKLVDYRLLGLTQQESKFYVLADTPTGRKGVYTLDIKDDAKELVYQHPDAEVVSITPDPKNSTLLSAEYFLNGYVRQHFFEDYGRDILAAVEQNYPNHASFIVSSDQQERMAIAYVHSSSDPGQVLLVDHRSNTPSPLGHLAPKVHNATKVIQSSSTAHQVLVDGLNIEYYLHKPKTAKAPPLIVYPHGGPYGVLDELSFNPSVQYLVQQGYAVLQVNFRGSAGYGESFSDAGKGEFGRKMLTDIEAALGDVSKQGVDTSRVCTMGESYGGYAALMISLRNPESIRCVVSFAGVYDLPLALNSARSEVKTFLNNLFLTEQEQEADAGQERLVEISPLYNLDKLRSPVLVSHGGQDRVVDIEQALRLKIALEAKEKKLHWLEYPNEEHGFSDLAAQLNYIHAVAQFLGQHL